MKRMVSLLILCALLCSCLVACGSSEPNDRYTLSQCIVNGVSYSASELKTLGIAEDVSISFSEDHTGTLCFGSQEMEFTWDDSYLTADGESVPYRKEGSKVILEIMDAELIFE